MNSRRDRMMAMAMLTPSLILLFIFVYLFIFRTVQVSLSDWGIDQATALNQDVERNYIGTENYESLMTAFLEFPFRNSLVNTFFFTIFFVGGCIVFGFLLALLLDQKIIAEGFFRTTFLFPMALSFVVTGTIWRWMLQPEGGVNTLLPSIFNGSPFNMNLEPLSFTWINSSEVWLGFTWGDVPFYLTGIIIAGVAFFSVNHVVNQEWSRLRTHGTIVVIAIIVYLVGVWDLIWLPLELPDVEPDIAPKGFNVALIGVIIAAVWQMTGYTMAIFLAGIRGIPEELREAARVDGASEIGVYTRIVLPQLRPIVLSAMIILGHISLKIFDLVWTMAGPDNTSVVVPGILVYTEGFRSNNFAVSSAIAVIMLFFVALVIVPYLWTQLRETD